MFDFHFGLGFMGALLRENKTSIEKLMKDLSENPFDTVPLIMHTSAKYAAKRLKLEFTLSVDDFTDILDDNGGLSAKGIEEFLTAFTNSMTEDVPKPKPVKRQAGRGKQKSLRS